jgi:conjugative transfer signal peptidase TraF
VVRSGTPSVNLRKKTMKVPALVGTAVALAFLMAPLAIPRRPLLIWNASPSVPVGLYRVTPDPPRVGDLVVLRLPPDMAALAASRRYLPRSVYLLKPVAAVAGDLVCRFGAQLFVRGRYAADAAFADHDGNPMPVWQGCRTLRAGEVFVLADHPSSFDSRYFGPLDSTAIVGSAVLLWRQRHSR